MTKAEQEERRQLLNELDKTKRKLEQESAWRRKHEPIYRQFQEAAAAVAWFLNRAPKVTNIFFNDVSDAQDGDVQEDSVERGGVDSSRGSDEIQEAF